MALKTRTIQFFVLLAVTAFILGINIAVIRYFSAAISAEQAARRADRIIMDNQALQLSQAEIKINALVSENSAVAGKIQEEIQKRLATEQSRSLDAARLKQLEQNTTPDLSLLISQWRPRVPLVQCEYNFFGYSITSSGSGVLFEHVSRNNNYGVVTNRHVVNRDNMVPTQCVLLFPGNAGTYTVDSNSIEVPVDGSDWAIIELPSLTAYLKSTAASSNNRCSSDPALGNEIVILGYPSIGSQTDITATEGIISGVDGDYFITSAKVERGNSGGAAILVKQNCYAGIPTFVGSGSLESLARILDQKIIFK